MIRNIQTNAKFKRALSPQAINRSHRGKSNSHRLGGTPHSVEGYTIKATPP